MIWGHLHSSVISSLQKSESRTWYTVDAHNVFVFATDCLLLKAVTSLGKTLLILKCLRNPCSCYLITQTLPDSQGEKGRWFLNPCFYWMKRYLKVAALANKKLPEQKEKKVIFSWKKTKRHPLNTHTQAHIHTQSL